MCPSLKFLSKMPVCVCDTYNISSDSFLTQLCPVMLNVSYTSTIISLHLIVKFILNCLLMFFREQLIKLLLSLIKFRNVFFPLISVQNFPVYNGDKMTLNFPSKTNYIIVFCRDLLNWNYPISIHHKEPLHRKRSPMGCISCFRVTLKL